MIVFTPRGGVVATLSLSQAPRCPLGSACMLWPASPSSGYVFGDLNRARRAVSSAR